MFQEKHQPATSGPDLKRSQWTATEPPRSTTSMPPPPQRGLRVATAMLDRTSFGVMNLSYQKLNMAETKKTPLSLILSDHKIPQTLIMELAYILARR